MAAVIRVTAESDLATLSTNVWHWQIPEANPVTEANAAIAALDTFYTAIEDQLYTATYTIGRVVQTVDQAENEFIGATPATVTTLGLTCAPRQASVVCKLRSNFVGGRRQGRAFLGPLFDEVIVSDGRSVNSGHAAVIQAALNALIGTTTSGIVLGVWSRTFQVFTAISSGVVNPVIGTQRRRVN